MPRSKRTVPLPAPDEWQHRPRAPGYFVTKDGCFQMLMTEDGSFVICTMVETAKKGYKVVHGPVLEPEELGIPAQLVAEGEELMMDDLMEKAGAGTNVTIQLGVALAPASRTDDR